MGTDTYSEDGLALSARRASHQHYYPGTSRISDPRAENSILNVI